MIKWGVPQEEGLEALAILQEAAEQEGRQLRILDVGGGMKPMVFATHIIDYLPFYNRAWYGRIPDEAGAGAERFTEETWLEWDICQMPWPYRDHEFDMVWCTQTVEDVRDPVGVIREIERVGKCGYLNTIDRNFESQPGVSDANFVGYVHHRWLISPDGDKLRFVFKSPLLHAYPELRPRPSGEWILGLWWTGECPVYEYLPMNEQAIKDELLGYAEQFISPE